MESRDLARGRFVARVDDANPRHVRFTLFDQGANAGTLTVDRETWEAFAGLPITGERHVVDLHVLTPSPIAGRELAAGAITAREIRP